MIGSEGLEDQSRDQMRPKNDELGWLMKLTSFFGWSANCEVLASKIAHSLANWEYQTQSSLIGPYTSAGPKGTYSKPRLSGSS